MTPEQLEALCRAIPAPAESKIFPLAPHVSDSNVELAKYRFMIQHSSDMIFDNLHALEGKQKSQECAIEGIKQVLEKMSVDVFFEQPEIKENWLKVRSLLKAWHSGDCTTHAHTCPRCYADELFFGKTSATWQTKNEGLSLYNQAFREMELLSWLMRFYNMEEVQARMLLSSKQFEYSWKDAESEQSLEKAKRSIAISATK